MIKTKRYVRRVQSRRATERVNLSPEDETSPSVTSQEVRSLYLSHEGSDTCHCQLKGFHIEDIFRESRTILSSPTN